MTVEKLNILCSNTLIDHLGIVFTELGEGLIKARMPVDSRTKQPMGLLHGGATLALAETVGSAGSFVMVDSKKYNVVGIEVNGNHIGNTTANFVEATGTLLHKGKRTHVWDIRINDEHNNPVSVCRVTNMLLDKEGGNKE